MDLKYIIKGSGPLRLWIHGLMGTGLNFVFNTEEIPGTHILPDLRNHGKSFHHPDCSFDAMASDITRLLLKEGFTRGPVLGHSLGGKVALQLAL